MSDLLTHIRRFELVEVDLDKEPQCESRHHETLPFSHGGEVTHVVRSTCRHVDGLRCARWIADVQLWGAVYCTSCDRIVPGSEIRFIEL